ncbi:(deoxy)nucleoside triphosphate pyrophosphohydrolase [Microbacteriaceae bacterium VKM Ac-2855]|nr:(deoxy)nucleoside triphosphate pyrophosphohydrolase [Microbacteriaceae bacterium VKM Ac-2855]
MSDQHPEPLRVVAAVIEDGDLVLVCRRAPGRASAGKWEFPGGKVEDGETAEAALVREIREELDVTIEVVSHLSTEETTVDSRAIRLECYRARLLGDRPARSSDHDSMLWLPREGLKALDWALPDIPAVRLLTSAARGL